MRAYAIRFDNSILDLSLVNLSYDGCAVETTEQLIPGELLRLSVLERGFVKAAVRWYKDRKAGLLFEPEGYEPAHKQRSAQRPLISAPVVLRRAGRGGYPVQTKDLTRFGCRCEYVERPNIGETVWIRLDGLEALEARTCWLAESNVGLEFLNPIHPAVFDLLLERTQGKLG
ncbi:PilZ domain-containing protein [Sphingomonas piscis]|nr:PilZ domain-containing protein [Sphingomonas piscis]